MIRETEFEKANGKENSSCNISWEVSFLNGKQVPSKFNKEVRIDMQQDPGLRHRDNNSMEIGIGIKKKQNKINRKLRNMIKMTE